MVWEEIVRKSIQLGRIDPADIPRIEDMRKSEYWNAISDFDLYLTIARATLLRRDLLAEANIPTFTSFCELAWYQFITTPVSPWNAPAESVHDYWRKNLTKFIGDMEFYDRYTHG